MADTNDALENDAMQLVFRSSSHSREKASLSTSTPQSLRLLRMW